MTPEIFAGLYEHRAQAFAGSYVPPPVPASPNKIISTICDYFNVTMTDLKSSSRKRFRTEARHVTMYFLYNQAGWSLKQIGKEFGGRDHSTVIYAKSVVDDLIDTDKTFKQKINDIAELLKN